MMRRLGSTMLAAALAALGLQGCSFNEPVGPRTTDTARLRLASTSPDAGALDLLINGKTVAHAVERTTASAAAEVPAGAGTGELRTAGTGATLATVPLTLEAGKAYTVLAAGPLAALTVMVSADTGSGGQVTPPPPVPVDSGTPPPPAPDASRFRLVHAAPHAPPLDPYLRPVGAPLDTLPSLLPFAYGSLALTADLIRAPGQYVVDFTQAGTTHVVLDSGEITAGPGDLITVVLGENADGSLRVDVLRERACEVLGYHC